MTLLSICQDALKDIGQNVIPSTIAGNSEADPELLFSLANRLGKKLAREFDWQDLLLEHTFTTVATQAAYTLPTDFKHFAAITQWDRTQFERVIGPTNPRRWQELQSAQLVPTTLSYFRLQGGNFNLFPTPATTGDTFAFEYYSKNWMENVSAVAGDVFTADDDNPKLDEELMILGIKWMFLRAKGEAFDDEFADYNQALMSIQANDNGPGTIHFGRGRFRFRDNIPDTGFGL